MRTFSVLIVLYFFCFSQFLSCSKPEKENIQNIEAGPVETDSTSLNIQPILDTSSAHSLYENGSKLRDSFKYDSSIICFKSAAKQFKFQQKWYAYLKCLLDIDVNYQYLGIFDSSKVFIDKAFEIGNKYLKGNDSIFSEIYYSKGSYLCNIGKNKESNLVLNQSRNLREKIKKTDDRISSKIFNVYGINYLSLAQQDKSLKNFEKALEIALKQNDSEYSKTARIYQNIGLIYIYKGHFDEAIDFYKKAIFIDEKYYNKAHPDLATIYMNLGVIYDNLAKNDRALKLYKKAEKLIIRILGPKSPKLGDIYINMGNIYISEGNFNKSLRYYLKGLSVFREYYEKNNTRLVHLLGNLYQQQGDYKKALNYYLRNITVVEKEKPFSLSWMYLNCASCYENLGDIQQAEKYYNLSINNSKKYFDNSYNFLIPAYLSYGLFLYNTGKKDNVKDYFINALNIAHNTLGHKHALISDCYEKLGYFYLKEGDYQKAVNNYHNSLVALVENFNNKDIYQNPGFDAIIPNINSVKALKGKAQSLYYFYQFNTNNINDLKFCLETYKITIKLIEQIRNNINLESKFFLAENEYEIYIEASTIALKLFDLTADRKYQYKAFQFAEDGKATILLSIIRDIEAKQFGRVPYYLTSFEKDLTGEINYYKKLIFFEKQKDNPRGKKIKMWEDKVFELKNQIEKLSLYMEESCPEYYKLKNNHLKVDVQEIRNLLNDNEAIIEYTIGDTILHTFVFTKDNFLVKTKTIDSTFQRNILNLRETITNKNTEHHTILDYKKFLWSSYLLYQDLIKPIEKYIEGCKICIIPDGKLGYFPFEVLIKALPDTTRIDYRNLNYLIKEFEISYSYSVKLLFNNKKKNSRSAKNLIAFIPTYENINGEQLHKNGIGLNDNNYLNSIPGAGNEIEQIKKYISCVVIGNTEATEQKFKKEAKDYDIIHLAMHGLLNDIQPMYSTLVFTQSADSIEDNLLHTYEIYNLNLNAMMVVLSSCNSGYGRLHKGEGMISLARGFMYAGIPSIIMTLWAIKDRQSARIMEGFYKYLAEGDAKNEALRKTKLDYLQNSSQSDAAPVNWAGYIIVGETAPLFKSKGHNYWIYLVISIPIIFILLIVVRKNYIYRKGN